MSAEYDVGIVGAGIVGLAHAYQMARRGLRVIVFERSPRACGASVRNFGMVWPVGQPLGPDYQLARRSRDVWREVLEASGLWYRECGSVHMAYHEDEAQVLREFVAESEGQDRPCQMLTPVQVAARFPVVEQSGLRAGLWSPTELVVDPRQIVAELPGWLNRKYGVEFAFATSVIGFNLPHMATTGGDWHVRRLVICTGKDFRELAPRAFADSGMIPVKLQMMRSQPFGDQFQIGAHLVGGLTLRHYAAFAKCLTLPAMCRRMDAELPEYVRYGIHVMVSQNARGELTIGDSHEYDDAITPFDNPAIDELILDYLKKFVRVPGLEIASRWHGIYAKHPDKTFVTAKLAPDALAVTGVGGAGMTFSFGLAERITNEWMGPHHD